jgi:hypothetical protein
MMIPPKACINSEKNLSERIVLLFMGEIVRISESEDLNPLPLDPFADA